MEILRDSSEDEIVLNFLLGEINSKRFSSELKKVLNDLNLNKSLINNAHLEDENENILRKKVLGLFRGYGEDRELFENFPKIKEYKYCDFTKEDLKNIYYINYSYWNELSNQTSLPTEAAKSIKEGKVVYDVSNDAFLEGEKEYKNGKCFLPIILLTHDWKTFIILEGHSRATIYALCGDGFKKDNCYVLVCDERELKIWNS